MDDSRFDAITRGLAAGKSRRSVLRGLIGGGAAVVAAKTGGALAAPAAKTTICHFPPGNPANVQVITVGNASLPAHFAHGDFVRTNCCVNSECADADICTINERCDKGVCKSDTATVDCEVSDWSDWSACSADCGDGTQTRSRTVLTPASCNGVACPVLEETQECNSGPCGCQPGYFVTDDGCEACPPGTFSDVVGSQLCSRCPVGTYAEFEASDDCTNCLPGTCAPVEGSVECTQCASACLGEGEFEEKFVDTTGWPEPADLKITCYDGPDSPSPSNFTSVCPSVVHCETGTVFLPLSYINNDSALGITAYDLAGNIVGGTLYRQSARYAYDVELDEGAESVTFYGQGQDTSTATWAELLAL